MKKLFTILACSLAFCGCSTAQTNTLVMFPLSQMFGPGSYNKAFRVDAVRPLITDGAKLFVGSFLNVTPTGGTNPIVRLTPNDYLVTFQDARTPWRISVPNTNGVLNALTLTVGPLPSFVYQPPSILSSIGYFATNTFYVFSNAGTSVVNGNYYPIGGGSFGNGTCFFSTNGLPTAVVYNLGDGTQYYATTNGLLGSWGNVWYSGGTPVGTGGAAPPPTVSVGHSVHLVLNYPLANSVADVNNAVGTNVNLSGSFSGSFSGNVQGTFTGDGTALVNVPGSSIINNNNFDFYGSAAAVASIIASTNTITISGALDAGANGVWQYNPAHNIYTNATSGMSSLATGFVGIYPVGNSFNVSTPTWPYPDSAYQIVLRSDNVNFDFYPNGAGVSGNEAGSYLFNFQRTSTSGVITNGPVVWYALKTNGVPNIAAPSGSICTTTNGQFFVRSNSVWLAK